MHSLLARVSESYHNMLSRGRIAYLIGILTAFSFVFTAKGTNFPSVYQIIHSVSCTTYQWDVAASGIVNFESEQGPVCTKEGVFGTTIKPAYHGRVNCTIDSTSGSIGVTVGFCFFNITSSDSGVYKITTAGTQRNGTIYVMSKPTTPQISPTAVETGRQETLTCTSTSTSTPSPTGQAMIYTWTVNNGPLSDPRLSSSGNTLTINTVRREDKDVMFQCTARENQGLSSDTTGISLTVHYPPQGKPVMSHSTLTYITGSTVTLSCSITEDGNPQATWTWRCGSRTFTGNNSITNSVGRSNLTFMVTKTDNNQPCRCTASSSLGSYSQTSDPATLDIQFPPQGKPVMTYSTLTYITGRTVTLSCSITEDGNPQATWTWRCGSRTFTSGITNSVGRSNLTFVVTKTDNNQPCTCTASSTVGSYSQTSDPATLGIRYPPQGKPVMTYSTLTYITGSTVTLSCSITEDGNPQASWTWRCSSRTFNSGITNSVGRSNLTFGVTKTDNNQPCTCTASSTVGSYSQTSDPATLNIQYPPEGVLSFDTQVRIYNESNNVTFTCSLTSNGNPPVMWIWTIGTRNFSSPFIFNSETQSVLRFQISKTENGQTCRCRAVSSQVSYDQSEEILLDVRYPSMILNLSMSKQTIMENENVSLYTVLEGNPTATVTWRNNDSNKTLKTEKSDLSILKFEGINCLDTATYQVTAFNGYGIADSRSFNISVLCPPRAEDASKFPQRVAVNNDKKLSVTFISIGNPFPTIQWYFRRNQSSINRTLETSMVLTETKSIGKVKYKTTLKRNLTSEDFGEYFAELQNTQGNATVVFHVVSQGRPDPPTDLLIDCTAPLVARLFWISQFNGLGEMNQQQFSILFKKNGTGNFTDRQKILSDTGWDKNLTGSLTLTPGVWIFKIEAQNIIGPTESVTAISCSVQSGQDNSALGSLPIAGVAGGIVAFIVLIAIIVVVILLRRKGLYAKKGSQYSSHKGPLVDDISVDDGIKDNILYQSADEAVGKKTINDNPSTLYAEVQKGTRKNNQTDGPASLYAEVQKPGKKGKRGKGKQKTDVDGGMVYENVDLKAKHETSFTTANGSNKHPRGQKNQDGLLYVDVDIKPRSDGKREVIIGEEDRTDYASVDFVFPEKKETE